MFFKLKKQTESFLAYCINLLQCKYVLQHKMQNLKPKSQELQQHEKMQVKFGACFVGCSVPHQDAGSFGEQLGRSRQLWHIHAGQQPVQPGMAAHPLTEVGHKGKGILENTAESQLIYRKTANRVNKVETNITCSWR